jgi:thiamine-monophosphate kinase
VHPVLKRRFPREWRKMVLGGGEDYELLFTASSELIARLKRELLCPVTEIGEIGSGKVGEVKLLDEQGKSRTWRRGGWEHFRYES